MSTDVANTDTTQLRGLFDLPADEGARPAGDAGSGAGTHADRSPERGTAAGIAGSGSRPGAPVIELHGASVAGPRGTVFGPLSATSDRPVTVVLGSRGTGRTSLLLSISGRMRLNSGTLVTLGESHLSEIRRSTGIVGFGEIDALEPAVSLGAILRERLSWAMPWYRRTPRMTPELCGELLAEAFGGIEQPEQSTLVRELNPAEEMLVRIALALTEEPELLVVDDFDALRDPEARALVAERLASLAQHGVSVVLATSDPGDAQLFEQLDPALIEL